MDSDEKRRSDEDGGVDTSNETDKESLAEVVGSFRPNGIEGCHSGEGGERSVDRAYTWFRHRFDFQNLKKTQPLGKTLSVPSIQIGRIIAPVFKDNLAVPLFNSPNGLPALL